MRVIAVGGTGFMGSSLARLLIRDTSYRGDRPGVSEIAGPHT